MNKLRIGILSTANIGRKNWKAIFHSGNCVVSAVASRDIRRSRRFIAGCQREFPFEKTPAALGAYEELLAAPDVDAIYVPLPTGLRREWVVRAAASGKHVLCEKPCARSATELDEMLAACRKHRVQFMDGVMFMHSPRLGAIRQILDDKKSVGEIRRISAAFSFCGEGSFFRDNIRVNGVLEPAGCLGDLGWYCIRFALWAMNWQMPERVTTTILSQSRKLPNCPPAPTECSAELIFPGNVSADFYCSFVAAHQQWVHVSGAKGWLRVPDFVLPFNSWEPAFEVNRRERRAAGGAKGPPDVDLATPGHPTAQDTRMFRNFSEQIFSGKLNEDWPQWALKTQRVLDQCLAVAKRH